MVKKDKLIKNVTIDELSVIVNNGFEGQTKFFSEKFDKMEKDVKEVKSLLIDFGSRTKNLETDVEYIRNTFSIPAIKKN